jgi:hypothetical protein
MCLLNLSYTDMNVLPPEGVTVVIENDTITVTNQTVDIKTAEEEDEPYANRIRLRKAGSYALNNHTNEEFYTEDDSITIATSSHYTHLIGIPRLFLVNPEIKTGCIKLFFH